MKTLLLLVFTLLFSAASFTVHAEQSLADIVAQNEEQLLRIFESLHRNPELAFQEVDTSSFIARYLKKLGYKVDDNVGGTGVVAILNNGPGPVVLLRTDMDGLPVKETTGLSYASEKTTSLPSGETVSVMHACGHDAHMTWLLGVAQVMMNLKSDWSGTLVLLAQPAEEVLGGARAMVADNLYKMIPKPDYALAMHTLPLYHSKQVAIPAREAMAGSATLEVTFFGESSHASSPHLAIDPVLMAARAILAYQTLVSREIAPQEPVVLTVSTLAAGTAKNIIPSQVVMGLNIRYWSAAVRDKLIDGIQRISNGIAYSSDIEDKDKFPHLEVLRSTLPVRNTPLLAKRASQVLLPVLGEENVVYPAEPMMAAEDFPLLFKDIDDMAMLYFFVGVSPETSLKAAQAAGKTAPYYLHEADYFVDLPALATGTLAMSTVLLDLMQNHHELTR